MIRKFNYTSRQKILQKHVFIRHSEDEPPRITLDFKSDEYEFSENSIVIVEAYHRTTYQRFLFGSFGNIEPPVATGLTEFTSQQLPSLHFRLKIIDPGHHGRLLGVAKSLPFSGIDAEAPRRSILGVECRNLGDKLWDLNLEDDSDRPWLILNQSIAGRDPMEIAASDPQFSSLVYPEVVRQILMHVLVGIDEDYEQSDTADEWQFLWICFGKDLIGSDEELPDKDDVDARKDWVDACVQAFCRLQGVRGTYEGALKEVYG